MKQIRLAKDNEKELTNLVREAANELLTVPKAANIAIRKGLPWVKKKHGKNGTKK